MERRGEKVVNRLEKSNGNSNRNIKLHCIFWLRHKEFLKETFVFYAFAKIFNN